MLFVSIAVVKTGNEVNREWVCDEREIGEDEGGFINGLRCFCVVFPTSPPRQVALAPPKRHRLWLWLRVTSWRNADPRARSRMRRQLLAMTELISEVNSFYNSYAQVRVRLSVVSKARFTSE
jgi:hypothetical protein